MRSFISRKPVRIAIYLVLDLISIGMGMGVPFFTILFGFPVGLILPGLIQADSDLSPRYLKSILRAALLTSTATVLILALIWLPTLPWFIDPARDLANFGIPMILYTPRASYIGWLVLMVLISPFLQFLMAVFGAITRIAFIDGQRDLLPGVRSGQRARDGKMA